MVASSFQDLSSYLQSPPFIGDTAYQSLDMLPFWPKDLVVLSCTRRETAT